MPGSGIILFDGHCNFCSAAVLFVIRRDPGAKFKFAASQSPEAQKLISEFRLGDLPEHSIVLIWDQKVYTRSGAALRIARELRRLWPVFYVLIILPPVIRDYAYDLFAGRRYRIFGKRDECFLPDKKIRNRFL